MEVPSVYFVFGHMFCLEGQTRGDLVTKMNRILGSMRRGGLIIASQGVKRPETHLPLQARWRT